ncbi:MAG: hypothetical protein ACRCUI_15270, partial [Polymorphobacter sp.]
NSNSNLYDLTPGHLQRDPASYMQHTRFTAKAGASFDAGLAYSPFCAKLTPNRGVPGYRTN